jgi:hypothetical protein
MPWRKYIYDLLQNSHMFQHRGVIIRELSSRANILIFNISIVRKIFGPVWDRGERRIRYNAELSYLVRGRDIVRFVKAERIRWLGHGRECRKERMPKRILNRRLFSQKKKGTTTYKMVG